MYLFLIIFILFFSAFTSFLFLSDFTFFHLPPSSPPTSAGTLSKQRPGGGSEWEGGGGVRSEVRRGKCREGEVGEGRMEKGGE